MNVETVTQEKRLNATEFLKQYCNAIARKLSPDSTAVDLAATNLSQRATSQTFMVQFDGQKKIIKRFDLADESARGSYIRERDALNTFRKSGLVPTLEFYSDKGGFLGIEFIEGADLRQVLDESSLESICTAVGNWIGEFTLASPRKLTTGTWQDYLCNFEALKNSEIVVQSCDFLSAFSFDRLVLAKNDGALSNIRFSTEARLFGFDLEHSQFKPWGWDLLLTARSLIRRFPQDAEKITAALADGFCEITGEHSGNYVTLLRIAAVSAAFEVGSEPQDTPAVIALRRHNEISSTPAQLVATAPFLPARMQAQDPAVVLTFKTHLQSLDIEAPQPDSVNTADAGVYAPKPALHALCTACQGSCCTLAVGRNAFIDATTLSRVAHQMETPTKDAITALYFGHLPEQHVVNSCLYHTKDGCALPRELRSNVCNNYLCRTGKKLLHQVRTEKPESVLCVAGTGADIRKAMKTKPNNVYEVPIPDLSLNGAGLANASKEKKHAC